MNFTAPESVLSPKGSVGHLRVLYNTGEGGWSLAKLTWEGKEGLGLRWNGHKGNVIGNPQSRGIPTWFIVPEEISDALLRAIPNENEGDWPRELRINDRIRLRPLPKRIWESQDQGPRDDDWLLTKIDEAKGLISVLNSTTGHNLIFYRSHVRQWIREIEPQVELGYATWSLHLNAQLVFENGNARLEPFGWDGRAPDLF